MKTRVWNSVWILILVALAGLLAVSIFTPEGENALAPGRNLEITLLTALALAVLNASHESSVGPSPVVAAFAAAALVLFPPIDAAWIFSLAALVDVIFARRQGSPAPSVLAAMASQGGLAVAFAWLVQRVTNGALLSGGDMPRTGVLASLLLVVVIGVAWWIAFESVANFTFKLQSGFSSLSERESQPSSARVLAAAAVGLSLGFWALIGTINNHQVIATAVLAAGVVCMAIAQYLQRARLTRERESAEVQRSKAERALRDLVGRSDDYLAQVMVDIHDGPIQALSSAAAYSDVQRMTATGETAQAWSKQRELVLDALEQLRSLLNSGAISVATTRDGVLEDVVDDVRQAHPSAFPRGVTLHVDGEVWNGLSKGTKQAALQIAREALLNAARHSGGATVDVALSGVLDSVVLEIRDDGTFPRSFDRGSNHLGVLLMDSRAVRVGGRIEMIENTPRGTRVQAFLPR